MRDKIFLFFYQFTIIYYQSEFTNAKTLIGDNVRSSHDNEFPFVVAIQKYYSQNSSPNRFKCTGSLISRSDVLTSEHCIYGERLNRIEIILGSERIENGVIYYPEWWISFDQWVVYRRRRRRHNVNDIAIVNLINRVPDSIHPAQMISISLRDLNGYQAQTAGWGLLRNDTHPHTLQTSELTIISKRECENKATNLTGVRITVDEKTICSVAHPFALLREGDSGGPLLLRNFIIGINFGTAPYSLHHFHPEKINLHVYVYYYYDYIIDLRDYY